MSSATATPLHATARKSSGHRHFLLRRLHSLTGLIFGGYICVHLLINATLIQGQQPRDVFAGLVNYIHSLPFLLAIEWALIFIPIIFHTVYGIWITFAAQPNVGHYPYGKNVFYVLQRVSAMIIVGFLIFHVLGMKGFLGDALTFQAGPGQAAASTARHINIHPVVAWFVYPLGVVASTYHLANGFWTAAITWGLTVSAQAQRRWGYVCAGIFVFTLTCGLLAWVAALNLKGTPVPVVPGGH